MAHPSSDEYSILVERAPIMIWRSDWGAGCDHFNQSWLTFTGAAPEHGWATGGRRASTQKISTDVSTST
jgi:hypothetical protein